MSAWWGMGRPGAMGAKVRAFVMATLIVLVSTTIFATQYANLSVNFSFSISTKYSNVQFVAHDRANDGSGYLLSNSGGQYSISLGTWMSESSVGYSAAFGIANCEAGTRLLLYDVAVSGTGTDYVRIYAHRSPTMPVDDIFASSSYDTEWALLFDGPGGGPAGPYGEWILNNSPSPCYSGDSLFYKADSEQQRTASWQGAYQVWSYDSSANNLGYRANDSIVWLEVDILPEGASSGSYSGSIEFYFKSIPDAPHSPIRINGNSEFTPANGVIFGAGTQASPYLIDGWLIDGAGEGCGIYVGNTTSYFRISGNHIFGSIGKNIEYHNNSGIFLQNVANGAVESNKIFSNNRNAIHLSMGCVDNKIANNTIFSNGEYGISLKDRCERTLIYRNSATSNLRGINIDNCGNNTIANNTALSNSGHGIYLYMSDYYNDIIGNNASSNGGHGIYLVNSERNNVTSNKAYLNVRGIALYNSKMNNLTYNIASMNSESGINITNSNNVNASYNNASYNAQHGVYISSSNANITRNVVWCNTLYGAYIHTGSGNRFTNNTFYRNHGSSNTYDTAHTQARSVGANFFNTTGSPGYGNWWFDWTSPDANSDGIVDSAYVFEETDALDDAYPLASRPV